ncbi:MAG: hypothetical protein ACLSVD_10965 [Eggerthellaceae bacterium]
MGVLKVPLLPARHRAVLIAALMFITCTNSTAGWDSVAAGRRIRAAVLDRARAHRLVLPGAETWLLFFSPKEFERAAKLTGSAPRPTRACWWAASCCATWWWSRLCR